MPLIYVQSYATPVTSLGTQYVTGTLSFAGTTAIELDPTLFTQAGTYVLFDYSAGAFPGGQAELTNNVTVDGSDLIGLTVVDTHMTDDTLNKRITVTLTT